MLARFFTGVNISPIFARLSKGCYHEFNHNYFQTMRAAIFYNRKTNPSNITFVRKVASVLDDSGIRYCVNPSLPDMGKPDLAIAVGGDGTVLYVANLLAKSKLPILGINFGHRGFLCEFDADDFQDSVTALLKNDFQVVEKTRIEARIRKSDRSITILDALNEISIGGINRTVTIETDILTSERKINARISGDGLIVSTMTGSTAYNINAGGPMLLMDAFTILANNAFFDSSSLLPITKSLVVPTDTVITIKDLSHNQNNLPFVIADGQHALRIAKDDLISIRKSKFANRFVKL